MKKSRRTIVRLFLVMTMLSGCGTAYGENLDSLLRVLDTCVARRQHYEEIFRKETEAVKKKALHAGTRQEALKWWNRLGRMEFGRHGDEALAAYGKTYALARELADYGTAAVAVQRKATVLGMCGFPWEGEALLGKAFSDPLLRPHLSRMGYYTVMYDLYDYFHAYDLPSELLDRNYAYLQALEDSVRKYETDSTSLSLTFHYSTRKVDDMIVLLKRRLEKVDPEMKGIIATTISNKYFLKRDIPQRDYYWALAAIYNIRSARHDNEALVRLAGRMAEKGDWKRASDYGRAAYEDARIYNSRSRMIEVAPVLVATQQYIGKKAEHYRRMLWGVGIAGVVLFSCLLFFVLDAVRRRRKLVAEKENLRAVAEEKERTLEDFRTMLTEKEESAVRFLNLALDSVLKFEQMKQLVLMRLESGESERLKKTMKNPALLDNFKETCLKRFDVAFLRLYPTFLKEVNALLRPDHQLVLPDTEIMNNELRLLAFLRIGITDSSHIAAILGVSVNTVYCYRTKIRNCALDRRSLEKQIAEIMRKE